MPVENRRCIQPGNRGCLLQTGFARGLVLVVAGIPGARPCAAQMLETETARLLAQGGWKAGGALEGQTSSDGRESAVPLLIEYGLTDSLELTFEPVPHTVIRPSTGRDATGLGDLETTLTYRFVNDVGRGPAMAVAAEWKAPTANDDLIGTGEADYAAYFITSKRFGRRVDTHFNVSYTFMGNPPGVSLKNVFGGAAAIVYRLGRQALLFGEVLGSTAASSEGEGGDAAPPDTTLVPEAAGSEVVGTFGVGWTITPQHLLYGGITYDNTQATQLRVGYTIRWGVAPTPLGIPSEPVKP